MSRKDPIEPPAERTRPQNIMEFAKLAGVSTATVSRALAGTGNLSESTRKRIRALAAEVGFRPSDTARNLRTGKSGAIGVVIPLGHEQTQHISDPFFMTLLGRIADRLIEHGYDLLLSRVTPTDPEWLVRLAESRRVDGMIIIGQSNQAEALNLAATEYRPMVVWGAHLENQRYCIVGTDNRLGGRLATQHLLDRGCKRLAFFGDPSAPEAEQRLLGFRDALANADSGVVGALLPVHFGPESALEAISGYLDLAERLDGIFAASDTIAMITIQALAERGRSVPGDVKVIGYDDLHLARHMVPPLTSVRQDLELGSDALVNALLSIMQGKRAESVVLQPVLVERGST